MAIDVRTIQMRRGLAVDFNPAKMVPGEWAVSQDNEKLYMCFTAGRVIEIGTASAIIHYVEDAEAWARGTRDGVPVDNSQPQYENNSKYYAETVAFDEAQNAEAWARGSRGGTDVPSTDPNYHNNSKYYSEQSDASAIASAVSALNAATSEDNAEAWARGTKNGTNVPSTDPTYHNNSKYYSEVADSRANDAEDHKENSEAWAVGTKNGVPVSSSDPQYQNSAKDWAEVAEAVVGIGIATTERAGIVKPDGETILVEPDGEILAPNVNSATEDFVKDTVGWTGKNLIPFPYENISVTHRGITFTANNDGTIGYAGTASAATTAYALFKSSVLLKAGSYKLTGGNSQTGGTLLNFFDDKNKTNYTGTYTGLGKTGAGAVYLNTTQNGGEYNINNVYGYEKPFTINSDAYVDIYARSVSNAYTSAVSGTIYPMLRLASINDATYEPYHKPVSEWAYTRSEANILGAKNFVKFPYSNVSQTINNITYTINNDGTVLINTGTGGASAGTAFNLISTANADLKDFPEGRLKLSTNINVSSGIWINIVRRLNGTNINQNVTASNTPVEFDWSHAGTVYNGYNCEIYISKNIEVSNLLIKPLVRLATDTDSTYQPYAETNYQLTHNKLSYEDNAITGVHNLLPYPYSNTTFTVNGVTFTDNGDGTVLINIPQTATNKANFWCYSFNIDYMNLSDGTYIISKSGHPDIACGVVYYLNSTWKKQINATENDETFVINKSDTSYNNIGVVIYVPANTTSVSNLLIKPQIRLASDSYSEYTQYAKTNRELTSDILSAQSDISTIQGKIPSGASSSNKFATASDITDINNKIPSGASSSNKMATASDITNINNKIPSGASSSNKMATASDITNINNKIPSGASSSNKLATQSQITSLAAADMHIYSYDTPTTSIAANSYKDVTIDGSSIFSGGEEMLGIVGYTFSGTTAQYLSLYNCTVGVGAQKIILGIHNSSGSAVSTSVKLKIMYRNTQ